MSTKFEFSLNITGPQTSRLFKLPVGVTTIGRQTGNHITLGDPKVSRQHAQIECSENECFIKDMGSANGTFVNNEKLPSQVTIPIGIPSIITIGPFSLALIQTTHNEIESTTASSLDGTENKVAFPSNVQQPEQKPIIIESISVGPTREEDLDQSGKPPPIIPQIHPIDTLPVGDSIVPSGLTIESHRLIEFLPGIYHTDFMARFLGIFESILIPIEWTIDNFDLFLDPMTSPAGFLTWLANLYQITWETDWSESQRRAFLKDAYQIFSRRGTRWALRHVLEIYTGKTPQIIDQADDLKPFTFKIKLPFRKSDLNIANIERVINEHKPAYTFYSLEFETK
jgi:phage tail-like protein